MLFATLSFADNDASPLAGKIYLTDSAADRCSVRDCLCRVTPAPPLKSSTTVNSSRVSSIYFSHNGDSLAADQEQAIISWVNSSPRGQARYVTVHSYTDGLGTREYNRALASRRNSAVRSAIRKANASLVVRSSIIGEAAPGHDPGSRRVDIVFHTSRTLTTKIDKIRADVYLIDASGSMAESGASQYWSDVVSASFRPGSKIYLSIMSNCRHGQRIDRVRPNGGTEIWYSYWKVLESMRRGQTLAIISDFDANYPLSSRESAMISARVREKGIKVVVIRP